MGAARPECLGCQRLSRLNAELREESQRLRERLTAAEQAGHRQAHPFRREETAESAAMPVAASDASADRTPQPKRAGRRKGHKADLRPLPSPEHIDRVIDVPLDECPMCQAPLYDLGEVVQSQTDLPPIVPLITQFNIQTGRCSCCRQPWQGRHPEQTSDAIGVAGNTLGPVVLTMAAERKHRLGVSSRKICDFLQTYCHMKVCSGAFIRAEQRLAELAKPTYELLLESLRQSHVMHADETGWRVGRANAWLWVFSSKEATIYAIRTGKGARGHAVPEDILGPDFQGYLIVDGLKTYDVLDVAKGRCNGHLLRRCKTLQETVPSREREHIENLSSLLQEAIALAQRRDELTADGYNRRVQEIENHLDDWLEANNRKHNPSADLLRLDMHIRQHRGEWLIFLHDPEVPPTNNHAEQMLRPAVITRKVGGCNKTLLGALIHSVLASLMVTCHRQGRRFLDMARQLWQNPQAQAIPVTELPEAR